jgi:hypothetical protein
MIWIVLGSDGSAPRRSSMLPSYVTSCVWPGESTSEWK